MLPASPLLNATAPAGPHLPTATLRQYAAGTLAPAARHRVEAHTLACPRCADILAGLLQTPAATTDQALAQLQQRLRLRVQQGETGRPVAGRTRPSHRWVVPQLAAAATLLFGLVAGGWWTWQQRHPAAPTTVAVVPAQRPLATDAPVALASRPAVPAGAIKAPLSGSTSIAAATKPAATVASGPLARRSATALRYASPRQHLRPPTTAGSADTAAGATVALASDPTRTVAPAASTAQPPVASAPTPATSVTDSAALMLNERTSVATRNAAIVPAPAMVRADAMPAARALPPAPVGGYPAWREQLRREAAEFKPDEGGSLSGSVQLRLTIGPDGKLQQIKVLHGLRADYDEEAQRLVCDGPSWVPGIGGGKRAAQSIDVAVPFQ